MSTPDPWLDLRRLTAARIALGRSGVSLPTAEALRFAQAHAMARDAVHTPLDAAALCEALTQEAGCASADGNAQENATRSAGAAFAVHAVRSAAPDRASYLRRPDLGRRLAPESAARLHALAGGPASPSAPASAPVPASAPPSAPTLAVVMADGLSATAVMAHGLPLLRALRPRLAAQPLTLAWVVVAEQARVALGDEVGALLGAQAVLVLVGERPGLSSPDSLGAYLTWAPRIGRQDAERNCVSNIRPEGLAIEQAAHKIAWLLGAARRLQATGVVLKDSSDVAELRGAEHRPAVATGLPEDAR